MNIKDLQRNWDELARTDPLWAIITLPDKKGNKWGIEEFFETGIKEVMEVLRHSESLGVNLQRRRALDFGCGVGRLTQAMAAGIPVIGSDAAGPREIVEAGKTGLLVPSGNPDRLGRAIIELLDSKDVRTTMGRRGQERVGDLFSTDHFNQTLHSVYQSISKERSGTTITMLQKGTSHVVDPKPAKVV